MYRIQVQEKEKNDHDLILFSLFDKTMLNDHLKYLYTYQLTYSTIIFIEE